MPSEPRSSVTSSIDQSELNNLFQLYPNEALKYIRAIHGSQANKQGKITSGVQLSQANGAKLPQSHYQETYLPFATEQVRPRSTKAPPPEAFFATRGTPNHYLTTNRIEYKELPLSRSPPIRKDERGGLKIEDWGDNAKAYSVSHGETVYRSEFVPRATDYVRQPKPADRQRFVNAKFEGETTNHEHFRPFENAERPQAYRDLPSFAGSLIFPGRNFTKDLSETKSAFKGTSGELTQAVKAKPDNIKSEGAMEFSTVTKDSFQAPGVSPRVLPVKHESHSPRELLDPRGRHAQTNDASDMRTTQMDHFRGFAGDDLLRARPDAARAPPSTIELTENGRRTFDTEQRTVFRGHDTRLHPAPRPIRSDRSVTTDLLKDDPNARFDATTSTHTDFQRPAMEQSTSNAKAQKAATSNSVVGHLVNGHLVRRAPSADRQRSTMREQFPDWSNRLRDDPALRVQHKNFDAYELYGRMQNYVLPTGRDEPHFPAAGDTTTKSTFVSHGGVAPPRSMKPSDANASALKSLFDEREGAGPAHGDAERFTMYHTDFRAPDIMSGLSSEERKRLLQYLREIKTSGPVAPKDARPSNGHIKTPTRQTKRV